MAGADVVLNIVDPGVVLNIAQTAIGPAGGDLTGAYPNPAISPYAIAVSSEQKDAGRRHVAAHEQSANPHGGRFPTADQTYFIARGEGHREVTRVTRAVPQFPNTDQASLTSQFFGG